MGGKKKIIAFSQTGRTCKKCGKYDAIEEKTELCAECYQKRKKIIRYTAGACVIVATATCACIIYKNKEPILHAFQNIRIHNKKEIKNVENYEVSNAMQEHVKPLIDNYLSNIDKAKIDMAVNEYGMDKRTASKLSDSVKHGVIKLDDYLKQWGYDEVVSKFPSWSDGIKNISEEEMKLIIEDAATETGRVKKILYNDGKIAKVRFNSASKKSTWDASFSFVNEEGELINKCTYSCTYDANAPIILIENIHKRMKVLAENYML